MKESIRDLSLWLGVVACVGSTAGACASDALDPTDTTVSAALSAPQAVATCALPSGMIGTNEETAWQLFANASCLINGKPGWETWTEQSCFFDPASCNPVATIPAHHLHASRLGQQRAAQASPDVAGQPGICGAMTTLANAPSSLKTFVPKNLTANPTFCEEVFVDAAEAAFVNAPVSGVTLTTLNAQAAYIKKLSSLQFPSAAVEIKVDWLPSTSVTGGFSCATGLSGVYTEIIDNQCYALVGLHISAKLLTNWLWATFEPQSVATNPNRCNPAVYSSCNDPWGSTPATSTGATTQQTAELKTLMTNTGIQSKLSNYRLVAAQSTFVDADNNPIKLGNSFVEFNAGVPAGQASCITCHSYAQLTTSAAENTAFGAPPGLPPIGNPEPLPPPPTGGRWLAQDFSWMLGVMPQN